MSELRKGTEFNPAGLQILGLQFSSYSRMIILEVLRGIGCLNERIEFGTFSSILEFGATHIRPSLALVSHETEEIPDLDALRRLRRCDNRDLATVPVIMLSSLATRSLIILARDAGIDEVVMRPLSALQLERKMRQLVESPRPFVTSGSYVGPCRRRKLDPDYSGARRRISDYVEKASLCITPQDSADNLATAVMELREACAKLSDNRQSLVARVRQTAERTALLAQETGDRALEKTAQSMKLYLDGIGAQNALETHVLETGINALTQLAVLPDSYVGARDSIAQLMSVAVRKKLMVYERRNQAPVDGKDLLEKINSGTDYELNAEDKPDSKNIRAG